MFDFVVIVEEILRSRFLDLSNYVLYYDDDDSDDEGGMV
jgi:hypothetical protein